MRKFSIVLATLAIGFLVASHSIKADDEALASRGIVQAGEYRDLTFLRRLRLGTASFVNPALVRSASVAYRYPVDIATDYKAATIAEELWQDGAVSWGMVMPDGSINVLGGVPGSNENLVVISTQSALGEVRGVPVVSWDPAGTVAAYRWPEPIDDVLPDIQELPPVPDDPDIAAE